MKLENHYHQINATLTPNALKGYILYTFILWMISIIASVVLLMPEAAGMLDEIGPASDVLTWFVNFAGIAVIVFLVIGPAVLFLQACLQYKEARDLDRFGIIVKGSVTDKWVDVINNKPAYYVSYKFLNQTRALQVVDPSLYQQVRSGQKVDVLYLEHSPRVSRLDFE